MTRVVFGANRGKLQTHPPLQGIYQRSFEKIPPSALRVLLPSPPPMHCLSIRHARLPGFRNTTIKLI
ncbi:hypothetical protein B0H12DRAFT_1102732 [Mycena haematopus]|nr:hypothetical protein B0H12DRAFT_1102732 [Mycena haematopus]